MSRLGGAALQSQVLLAVIGNVCNGSKSCLGLGLTTLNGMQKKSANHMKDIGHNMPVSCTGTQLAQTEHDAMQPAQNLDGTLTARETRGGSPSEAAGAYASILQSYADAMQRVVAMRESHAQQTQSHGQYVHLAQRVAGQGRR